MSETTNDEIADALERVGELLEVQGGDHFRVRAYASAAQFVRGHDEPLAAVLERGGHKGLVHLPSIGESLARLIEEILATGRSSLLARLEGEVEAEELFDTLPGVGAELAAHIHKELSVETFEELEIAAHDGRLERVSGIGPRRAEMIRDVLAVRLSEDARARARSAQHRAETTRVERPPVRVLLEVDADYRRRAAAGTLRRIAPRRFNPEGEAWLPVFHDERAGWSFNALFSNTARAHELGKTDDWVVIFYERGKDEGQCTVVTETHGAWAGQRVVRGREGEMPEVRASGA